jgi:single-strand DNA-binding protein
MARGVNKVIAVGNLGADPETKYMPSGVACSTFSVAVSEKWTDKQSGEVKERTEWIRAETWGKLAEIVAEYLRKGSQVYVEGSLRTDSWEDEAGNKKYMTKVRVDNLQMLGGKGDSGQRQPAPQSPPQQDEFDDDIPF